jgi:hypothetical protein
MTDAARPAAPDLSDAERRQVAYFGLDKPAATDRAIWKYTVPLGSPTDSSHAPDTLNMPAGARVLAASLNPLTRYDDPLTIEMWAEVDMQQVGTDVERTFVVVGTGWPLPEEPTTHIATVRDGRFVWHLLEVHRA